MITTCHEYYRVDLGVAIQNLAWSKSVPSAPGLVMNADAVYWVGHLLAN